jgi:thioredoxin 1
MAYPFAVSDSSFDKEVLQSDQPVLVDFWAEWCGPCRMIAPVLEKLADEYSGNLRIAKLDVDANQRTMMQYGVQSIPSLILFKDGKEVERLIGYMPKERLVQRIRPHIGTAATA